MSGTGGGDSGVETECEAESNDSFMSALSVSDNSNMAAPALPPSLPPHPPHQEDGYLGDCSSDGGNDHVPSRVSLPPSPGQSEDDLEPPAGLVFSSLRPSSNCDSSPGYHVLPQSDWSSQSSLRTKVRQGRRTAGFRSNLNPQVQDDWAKVKRTIAERKLRTAANTNNSDQVEQLLSSQSLDVNSQDELKRSALHFASAKGYSSVVEVLLRHGADPNLTDRLGNTALHLAACTSHVPVVTLLLRAGTALTAPDNNGRTPLQLAQSKLKILQRHNSQTEGITRVKTEITAILEMMAEYMKRVSDTSTNYEQLIESFSQRLNVHTSHSQITNDLGNLLTDLASMTLHQD